MTYFLCIEYCGLVELGALPVRNERGQGQKVGTKPEAMWGFCRYHHLTYGPPYYEMDFPG